MPLPSNDIIQYVLENETNENILELTSSKIKNDKNDILQKLQLSREKLKLMHISLKKYRFISDIKNIILGNYIRWINLDKTSTKLTNGAFAVDFKETENGIFIRCKTQAARFFNININNCVIFQKLNAQETILLSVINYLDK